MGALLARGRRTPVEGVLLTGALAVMSAAFILAQSRGAWLSLAVSLLVMAGILLKKRMVKPGGVFLLLLVLAAVGSFVFLAGPEVSQRADTMAVVTVEETVQEDSFRTRLLIWRGALDMIKENPLVGTGIGTFVWAFPRYRPAGLITMSHYAHNDYLHIAAEMGVLAFFIAVWMLVALLRAGTRKKDLSPETLGCTIGVLSVALHGLVDFNFHIPANMLLCVVFAAFIMQDNSIEQGPDQRPGR